MNNCPECGLRTKTIFDHIDIECDSDMEQEEVDALLAEVAKNRSADTAEITADDESAVTPRTRKYPHGYRNALDKSPDSPANQHGDDADYMQWELPPEGLDLHTHNAKRWDVTRAEAKERVFINTYARRIAVVDPRSQAKMWTPADLRVHNIRPQLNPSPVLLDRSLSHLKDKAIIMTDDMSTPSRGDEDFDFSAAPRETMEGDRWAVLRRTVAEQAQAEKDKDAAEAAFEAAKTNFAEYRDKKLPEVARGMGWTGGTVDGFAVVIKDDVVGKLPTEDVERAHAFAYLEELQEGDSIKRVMCIELDRNALELERRVINRLTMTEVSNAMLTRAMSTYGIALQLDPESPANAMRAAIEAALGVTDTPLVPAEAIETNVTINAQRLCKIGRDRIKKGLDTDLKRLGLIPITRATVKAG